MRLRTTLTSFGWRRMNMLEARSSGQKIMVRIGSANAERVKAKLRVIRRELTSHAIQ